MNRMLVTVIFLLIQGCNQLQEKSSSSDVQMPDIRLQLLEMRDKDQQVRKSYSPDKKPTPEQIQHIENVDRINSQTINSIVQEHGWPSIEMIGKDGVNAFWLILQHSDDYQFQKDALPYITRLYQTGTLNAQSYSLFVDRVLVHDGKPQMYGTQIKGWDNKNPILYTLDDPDNVNVRREKIGLFPLEAYLLFIKQQYHPNDELDEYLNDGKSTKTGQMGFQLDVEGDGSLKNMAITSLTVAHIDEASAAEKSGLLVGDSIVEINGISVDGAQSNELMDSLSVSAGERVHLVVTRANGQRKKLVIIASEKL